MEIRPSDRIRDLETGIFSELARRKHAAKQAGRDIIDLSVGSPDLPPPPIVMETLAREAQDPRNYGYTLAAIPGFAEAVAHFYHTRYGVDLDPAREVIQLMGSQDGLAHLAMALINPGDIVFVPDPGYPIYEAGVRIAGGVPYPLPLQADHGFLPDLDAIPPDVARRARMLILSYPGNPVTALADEAFFERAVAFARNYELLVVHDFAYSELVFDGVRAPSFLSVPGAKEVGIEFNSLSKTFNMAGCRIGYVCGHPGALAALMALKSHIDYGVFAPIQRAAIAALTADPTPLTEQVHIYERRRDALVEALDEAGWRIDRPQATMFAWARIPDGFTSREFSFSLLEATGVAVTPGDAFGQRGEGFVRIALVQPEQRLREAARRIGDFLRHHAR